MEESRAPIPANTQVCGESWAMFPPLAFPLQNTFLHSEKDFFLSGSSHVHE